MLSVHRSGVLGMDYKYILFDFDGTLSDSAPGVLLSFERALTELGREIPGREVLIRFVGPPLTETFTGYFGFSDEELPEVLRIFRREYAAVGLDNQKMFPGVPEMLERIKGSGRKMAVATSKRESFARQICREYGIADYFEIIAGSSEDDVRNRKDDIIVYALSEMGVTDRAEVLMVGDRLYDVEGAKNCGIDCMGILYGYGDREELEKAGAKYIAETTKQAADMILS